MKPYQQLAAGMAGVPGYAAANTFGFGGQEAPVSAFQAGQRKRINLLAICLNVLIPWLIFSVLFGLMSFSYHFTNPTQTYLSLVAGLGLAALLAYLGNQARKREYDPMWYNFGAICVFVAVLLAGAFGTVNFKYNMKPYYVVENMNTYPSIDPATVKGLQVIDAGRAYFTEGTALDMHKAIGHKDAKVYCVAPIISGNGTMESYDFWAVGVDCCSGISADFHCGEYNNPHARAGLRMMLDEQQIYYQTAVEQAQAAYDIKFEHPLFFYWMQDPVAEMVVYRDAGTRYFMGGMFTYFAVQLFVVIAATIAFTKIGQL